MPLSPLRNPDFPDSLVHASAQDRRNVIDHYKSWEDSQIRADLRRRAAPLEVVAENFAYDFNIATLVRNCNAFNARGVHIIGRKRWDRRGAVGTYHYTPVTHHENAERFLDTLVRQGFTLVAVDNIPGSVRLDEFTWPANRPLAVVFGQESIGVSNLALRYAEAAVKVEQFGSVRSLNVGVTSGIVLHALAARLRAEGLAVPIAAN
jgi:tRNA G18 (ribose-2'-O)-methylase SpoU